jgi:hypothetical protein
MPFLQSTAERRYDLAAEAVGSDGFDAMLETIDPDWREHLGRTAH